METQKREMPYAHLKSRIQDTGRFPPGKEVGMIPVDKKCKINIFPLLDSLLAINETGLPAISTFFLLTPKPKSDKTMNPTALSSLILVLSKHIYVGYSIFLYK